MSETVTEITQEGPAVEVPDEDDVRRTLTELQRKYSDTEKELTAERNRRVNLESNLEGERVARTTAESERDTHAARVTSESELRWAAEKNAASTAIAAKEKVLENAEEDYARHAELGEWKDAAKAQRIIASEAAEIHALRQKSEWLDNNKEKLVQKPVQRIEQPRPAPNEVLHKYSTYVKGPLVGGEEAWLDARPQFQHDDSYRAQVFAASDIASRKHARGSDAYFRQIERILEEDAPAAEAAPMRQAPTVKPTRGQSADLPPSRRAAPGANPVGSKEFSLTQDEAEIADGMWGDPNNADFYIADQGKRYEHYHTMKLRKSGR